MKYEIEVKVRIKNKKRLLQRFKLLSIQLKNKQHQVDIYYSPAKGPRFIGGYNKKLRVRKNLTTSTASFDFHLTRGLYEAEEHEVDISDGDMMDIVLKNLNFKEEARIDKMRSKYKYKIFNIDLDKVKGLGTFLEIEIMDATNKKKALKKIKDFIVDLGLNSEDIVRDRYLEMILRKQGKK